MASVKKKKTEIRKTDIHMMKKTHAMLIVALDMCFTLACLSMWKASLLMVA